MTALDTRRGEMPATRSYDRREWFWVPADAYETDRDGTLTIKLTHTGKRVARTEISVYAVQVEWEVVSELGVWSFLLENWTSPDECGPFRCVVGDDFDSCQCEAGSFDQRRIAPTGCKHRSACRALLEAGVF